MKICVFCSSSNAIDTIYVEEAVILAKEIGERGHVLINGGANVGLMQHLLRTASAAGARTVGVIPEKLKGYNLGSSHADELIVASDMSERKLVMRKLADAFIAMPGGFGTLEEILEVITLKQLDYHNKAIVFLNTNGFFNDLFRHFERAYSENFAKQAYREMYFIAKSAREALDYLADYAPPLPVNKWYEVPAKRPQAKDL